MCIVGCLDVFPTQGKQSSDNKGQLPVTICVSGPRGETCPTFPCHQNISLISPNSAQDLPRLYRGGTEGQQASHLLLDCPH